MSDLVDQQMRYWDEFLTCMRRNGNEIAGARGPYESTSNELLVNVGGGTGVVLRAWTDRREGFIAVALYLTDEGKYHTYGLLEEHRQDIDAVLGGEVMEWRPPGVGRPAGYVAISKRNADPTDESDWVNQFAWLQEKLERYSPTFSLIVKLL